jgi:peptide/nickel transport system ATP-binding protein
MELYEPPALPNPERDRLPLSAPGLGRAACSAAMTAMAMACRPDLIIFDEPTTALDVTTQIEVLAAIRDIVDQFNTAAIYITHDLAVVAQMADTIKVLLKGEEVEEADTRRCSEHPKEDYTKSLWAVRSFKAAEARPARNGRSAVVSVKNVDAAYGPVKVLERCLLRHPSGMHRSRGGRIRLGQVDHGALSSPAFCRRRRAKSCSTARSCRLTTAAPRISCARRR